MTLSLLGALAMASTGCESEPFPESQTRDYGTFGQEAYVILYQELLWSGSTQVGQARAEAFGARQGALVAALDQLALPPVDTQLIPFLEELLPLYDDDPVTGSAGALPQMTRDLASVLDVLVADERNMVAMAQLDAALGANPDAVERMLGAMIRHPIDLADPMSDMMLDLKPELAELFRWLHRELPAMEDSYVIASNEKSFLQRLLEIELPASEQLGPLVLSARFDGRGAPVVVKNGIGQFPSPFVDADVDGAVDVDDFGRPVDDLGFAIHLPTFSAEATINETRDLQGRAIVDGALVYEYFDVRRSALAYLLRDGRRLLTQGAHYDMFSAFEALLGGRATASDEDGQYTGYFVAESSLLDLMYVVNEMRSYPRLIPLVRALEAMVTQKEPLFRQLFYDIALAIDILEDAPSLTPGNTLFDEIHAPLASLAENGLVRALIKAATTPENQAMFRGMATMMRSTTLDLPLNIDVLTSPSQVDALDFINPTPWDRPDTTDADRSMFQKAAYLLADTSGTLVAMKLFDQVEINDVIITDDMALFYVNAIGGGVLLDLGNTILETLAIDLVDEFDDLILSAEELNLFMNHDQSAVGNPVCGQGIQVRNHYGPALLALQASGSLDALRPWILDIVAAGRQQDFIDVFKALAKHYSETPSNANGFRAAGTGFRRLEPFIARILGDTRLGDHFLELSAWMHTATFSSGGQNLNVADELDLFLRYMLDKNAGLTLRNGTSTIVTRGGETIQNPTRVQVLVHSFDKMDAALDADPAAGAAWDRLDLVGVLLDLDSADQLVNKHALDLIVALVPILAEEATQAIGQPDWNESITTFVSDLEDAMGSRGFTAAADAVAKIRDTDRHRAFVDTMLGAMLAEEPPSDDTDIFGAQLRVLSMLVQLRVPMDAGTQMMRFLGEVVDPDVELMFSMMESLRDIQAIDRDKAFTALLSNLFYEPTVGNFPYRTLKNSFKSALREPPGADGPYSAADFRRVLEDVRDWLRDDKRGAERLYDVILSR
ncbi:MAG: hypothetical protein ACI9MR_000126 [Myxococcota bacterium]|jgi:hypothetical protein